MKKTNEKGITIITLVITIIILLILASIGVNSGKGTIELAKYDKLRNELTIIQTKVNDLNQENKTEIGQKISTAQKSILNIDIVSNIIYSGRTEAEKAEIENGFRYCSSNYIEKQFELDGIERDYLINVEYRYVVSCEGLEYKGTIYYMIDQMESGLYNVAYHNKNSNTGSFDVSAEKVGEKYKISVSNIQHEGYVSNWQVKYKLSTEENWKTSNKLEFEVENGGNYIIKVVHGNEIDLGEKTINIYPKYVISNLILNYDAINNISETESDLSTNIWKDLSNSKNDANIIGANWGKKYLSFDGVNDFAKTTSKVDYGESHAITVQFVLIDGIKNGVIQMILESSTNWNVNHAAYGLDFCEGGTNNINMVFHHNSGYNVKTTDDNIVNNNEMSIFTVVFNNDSEYNSFMKIYKNGKLINTKVFYNYNYNVANTKFENYMLYIASRAGESLFTEMKLGALRIYNRELNEDEIQYNYELDNKRFK